MDVAPGGWRYAALPTVLGLAGVVVHPAVAVVGIVLGGFALAFHRDPERSIPVSGLLAPADGTVTVVREADERLRVGTFMNLHHVHVQRAPLAGTVQSVEHQPGAHRPAFSKDSERNERLLVDLETAHGPVRVVLIAGAFARRIHPYVEAGDELARGQRLGHISFGSRVDVVLPPGVEDGDLAVEQGESVLAGETRLVDGDALSGVR